MFGADFVGVVLSEPDDAAAKVCAWIDVSNALHPESAAAAGVDLSRLLWVRCGVPASTNAQQSLRNGFALPEKYLVASANQEGSAWWRFRSASAQ